MIANYLISLQISCSVAGGGTSVHGIEVSMFRGQRDMQDLDLDFGMNRA